MDRELDRMTRKQLKETLVREKVRFENLLSTDISLHTAIQEFEKQTEIFKRFRGSIEKSIAKQKGYEDYEKVVKLQAELYAVEQMFRSMEADLDKWIADKRERIRNAGAIKSEKEDISKHVRFSPETLVKDGEKRTRRLKVEPKDDAKTAELVGATAMDYGGARSKETTTNVTAPAVSSESTASAMKQPAMSTSVPVQLPNLDSSFIDELADSIIKKCGWTPHKLRERVRQARGYDEFNPPFMSTPDERGRSSSSDMEMESSQPSDESEGDDGDGTSESSEESMTGPELSLSDVMHGHGNIPGARIVGNNPKCDNKQKKTKQKDGDSSHGYGYEKYMSRISLPVFEGKTNFESWWSIFQSLVEKSDEPVAVKFLRLRNAVAGEPAELLEHLPHDSSSYEVAKRRIFDQYGGLQRNITRLYHGIQLLPVVEKTNDFSAFRKLQTKLDQLIQNLRFANRESELSHGALVTIMVGKMPYATVEKYHEWRYAREKVDSLMALGEFLEQYIARGIIAMETIGVNPNRNVEKKNKSEKLDKVNRSSLITNAQRPPPPPPPSYNGATPSSTAQRTPSVSGSTRKCKACGGPHPLWFCNKFKNMSLDERWNFVKSSEICFKCLSPKHMVADCKSTRDCKNEGCKANHHTMLHRKRTENKEISNQAVNVNVANQDSNKADGKEESTAKSTNLIVAQERYLNRTISLRIAPIVVVGVKGRMKLNALLDDASTTTYINEDVARDLGLKGDTHTSEVNVIDGHQVCMTTELVDLTVESVNGRFRYTEVAEVSNKIVNKLRVVNWNNFKQNWPHLSNIEFPDLGPSPRVDVLLGCNFVPLIGSIEDVTGPLGSPSARLTPLGWTCIGSPDDELATRGHQKSTFLTVRERPEDKLDRSVQRFWEWESVPVKKRCLTLEEQKAERIVKESMTCKEDRYTVAIPWINGQPYVPDNRDQAIQRLYQTERTLFKHPELAFIYDRVFRCYLEKGYIEEIDPRTGIPGRKWYMPHFMIFRPGAITTKVRPVFDPGTVYKGQSISYYELTGPKELQNLILILLRFRRFPVALVCDIAEMYLQILVDAIDRDYQRFVWRFLDVNAPIRTFRGTRVMFGKKSSPYLALAVAKENALTHQDQFPLAAQTVLYGTYMDDSLDSVLNEDIGIRLYRELKQLWAKASMQPHKWATNSLTVLAEIPEDKRAPKVDLMSAQPGTQKMLGLGWDPVRDFFVYASIKTVVENITTKRAFLKTVAGIYDPLGFLGPFMMRAKVYLQMMWISGISWDESLVGEIRSRVESWLKELAGIDGITVDRAVVKYEDYEYVLLHIFGDASIYAYGAVAYAVTYYLAHPTSVSLVMAKGRVAPISTVSVPRLELEAAVVATMLSTCCDGSLVDVKIKDTYYWSDSQDVLYWVHAFSRAYKAYAANRISKIQEVSAPRQWKYVPTSLNPADMLSRGLGVTDLVTNELWNTGPPFIMQDETAWPEQPLFQSTSNTEAEKRSNLFTFLTVQSLAEIIDPTRFSSFLRFCRTIAWVFRFLSRCRVTGGGPRKLLTEKEAMKRLEPLLVDDVDDARNLAYKIAQERVWSDELKRLREDDQVKAKSEVRGLLPWLDETGVMRCTMRTTNAEYLSWDTVYPVLLPRFSKITELVILDVHQTDHHISVEHTVTKLRQKYFIPSIREAVRSAVKKCMRCKILLSKPTKQLMGVLPSNRVNSSRVFEKSSLDFAGPFYIKIGRGKQQQKRWICLFDCLAVRAIHLEIVSGMDTDAFILALTRFSSLWGAPSDLYADNGSNIVRAEKDLKEYIDSLDQTKIVTALSVKQTRWHFQPAAAPHFGGPHEALVKSVKRALWKTAGTASLTDDEFRTVCAKVQSTMNSRPLSYQGTGLSDNPVLTPSNFMIGTHKTEIIPVTGEEVKRSADKRWQQLEVLAGHFWKRWREEFIPTLGPRKKWIQAFPNVKEGDVVHVLDIDTARGHWPLGIIDKVFPGRDGYVRAVEVRVGKKLYSRPIVKICPLGI